MNLQDIDPAFDTMKEFSNVSSGTASHIHHMRQNAIFTDGVLEAKLKTMAAMLWSVSARCEPCLKYYAAKAVELGATREELGEMLAVASTMGGCVGEMWAVKAFAAAVSDGKLGGGECCT